MVSSSHFHDDLFKGGAIKELIKVLLDKSGYTVYPYGYESTFSGVKKKLMDKEAANSPTVRRIKSSPDLLVYDEAKKDVMLVEVKMRRAPRETKVLIFSRLIRSYKEFWSDSILVIVIPRGHVFYAQRANALETKEAYNAKTDFVQFEEIFTKVSAEDLSSFATKALQTMKK
jgi:hypothetical protein